jgi:acetylornithine deacetylase/succinyl-diaminopimelate desuccinylase-like protein
MLSGGTTFEPSSGRGSVVYRIAGQDPTAPSLMLMGHLDVVPVSEDGWSTDPFGAAVADGFVWGRGAVDMLNMTAAMAVVFERWQRDERPPLRGDLVFFGVADEEAGGTLGAAPFLEAYPEALACSHMLTEIAYPDISLGGTPTHLVNVAEKGVNWRKVGASGQPGHASTPYGRSNALLPIARTIVGLTETPAPVAISNEWRAFVDVLDIAPDVRSALLDPDQIDEVVDRIALTEPGLARYIDACTHLSVASTVVSGGTKANTIADRASLQVDVRMLPGQSNDDVDEHFRKALGPTFDELEITIEADDAASSSPAKGLLWESLGDAYHKHTGQRAMAPTMTPAATDARFFRKKGVISYGAGLFDDRVSFPDFLDMFHGNDERISVDSLRQTVEFLDSVVSAFDARSGL